MSSNLKRRAAFGACAIALASGSAAAGQTQVPPAAQTRTLPSGLDARFREKLLSWQAPARAPLSAIIVSKAGPQAPVASMRLSSGFGLRTDPFNRGRRRHLGVDIPGPLGTPVRATDAGTVVRAGRAGGYGNLVELDHGGGVRTRYGHLSTMIVVPGIQVAKGAVIGQMGSTGRSTGSHLHYEVRVGGQAVDPFGHRATISEIAVFDAPEVAARWTGLSLAPDKLPSAIIR